MGWPEGKGPQIFAPDFYLNDKLPGCPDISLKQHLLGPTQL